MARTAIQSNKKKEKVSKLCDTVRGPYQILCSTGYGSDFVKKLHKPDSPELNFMAYDLYPLLPSPKPCEPVDTTDTRYLNQSHVPLTNSLEKALRIELYNNKWFNKPLPTSISPFTYQHDILTMPNESLPSFSSVIELHEETHRYPPRDYSIK